MIEVVEGLFKMVADFINWFFTLNIDLTNGVNVSIGELVTLFVFTIGAIYILFSAIGIINNKGGGNGGGAE